MAKTKQGGWKERHVLNQGNGQLWSGFIQVCHVNFANKHFYYEELVGPRAVNLQRDLALVLLWFAKMEQLIRRMRHKSCTELWEEMGITLTERRPMSAVLDMWCLSLCRKISCLLTCVAHSTYKCSRGSK